MADDQITTTVSPTVEATAALPPRRQAPRRSAASRDPEPDDSIGDISALLAKAQLSKVQRQPQDIQAAGVSWNTWEVMAARGDKISDALSPRYLWNKHEQFREGDTVIIKHPLLHWVLTLYVIRIDIVARGIVMHISRLEDFTRAEFIIAPTLANAKVEHLGDRGWCVVDSGHVAKEGCHSQTAAEEWLRGRVEAT